MLLDNDKKIVKEIGDNAFLNEDIILKMGFKFAGEYNDMKGTRAYTYTKGHLGRFDIFTQKLDMYPFKNRLVPETNIVVVANVTHPITNDVNVHQRIESKYLLTVGELKHLIAFRRLTTKICNLQHQAEDMLRDEKLSSLRDFEHRVAGLR